MGHEGFDQTNSPAELTPEQELLNEKRKVNDLEAKVKSLEENTLIMSDPSFTVDRFDRLTTAEGVLMQQAINEEQGKPDIGGEAEVMSLVSPREDLKKDVEGRLVLHQKVNVTRSSGEKENDWYFMGIDSAGQAVVRKREKNTGDKLTKRYGPDRINEILS